MISNPASVLYQYRNRYPAANEGKSFSHKDFGDNPELTLSIFKNFYFECFPSILDWFYPYRDDMANMILFANIQNISRNQYGEIIRPRRIVPFSSYRHSQNNLFNCYEEEECLVLNTLEQYFCSISVYFTNLIPQVMTRALGFSARRMFLKAKGWPEMSAGLGGLVSPEQWLKDSEGLLPCPKEAKYYNKLLEILLPFFSNELEDFLSGGQPHCSSKDYKDLTKIAIGRVGSVIEELNKAVASAKENFSTGQIPVYYLSQEEMYGSPSE